MSDLIDPWDVTAGQSAALIDPWDAAIQQQASTMLPTAALPSAPTSTEAPAPLVASDLNPAPQSPAGQPAAPTVAKPEGTPISTYLILGTLLSGLAYLAWKYYGKDFGGGGEPEGGVDGLGDLDALQSVSTYALPVSEKHYFLVDEVGKAGKKIKVQFPESGAVISVDPDDLLSENDAKKQGLEER